jgi:molybdate transport system substrate-binding protein
MARKLILTLSLFTLLAITTPNANAEKKILVFAASSLTDSYSVLGKRFERSNPGTKVIFSFQSSSLLANQINQGAPADIFISAEPFVGGEDYLINRVVIAVPINSKIMKASDLNNRTWIQCSESVPCGKAASLALVGEGIKTPAASMEPRVSSVVSKLLSGEVDAAIIYRTDVIANSKKLRAIEFANTKAAITRYQSAKLTNDRVVNALYSYLKSASVLNYMKRRGFETQ